MLQVYRSTRGKTHDRNLTPTPQQISDALATAGLPVIPNLSRYGEDTGDHVSVYADFNPRLAPGDFADVDADRLGCSLEFRAPMAGCHDFDDELSEMRDTYYAPDAQRPLPCVIERTLQALPGCTPIDVAHFVGPECNINLWLVKIAPASGSTNQRYAVVKIGDCE